MKKSCLPLALLAALLSPCSLQGADALWSLKDLTPFISVDMSNVGSVGVASSPTDAIDAADVFRAEQDQWFGTWERGAAANQGLYGQVGFNDGGITLQIGRASDGVGNFAAMHFAYSKPVQQASLEFTMSLNSTWGNNIASADFTYTAAVYGYDSAGNATLLGSWEQLQIEDWTPGEAHDVSIALDEGKVLDYDSYGVIFNSREALDAGGGAGASVNISNIRLVPEPASVSLGAFGFGIMLLRRRRSRRG